MIREVEADRQPTKPFSHPFFRCEARTENEKNLVITSSVAKRKHKGLKVERWTQFRDED
jgi:hypothetical protein